MARRVPPAQAARVRDAEKTRLRQKRGEISDDFDAGALTLALFAASIAPAVRPAFARAFVGLRENPSSQVSPK